MCTQRRLQSDWASALSNQSSLCAQWVAKDPRFLHADSEDRSDWSNAQADPSLHWELRLKCCCSHKLVYWCRSCQSVCDYLGLLETSTVFVLIIAPESDGGGWGQRLQFTKKRDDCSKASKIYLLTHDSLLY